MYKPSPNLFLSFVVLSILFLAAARESYSQTQVNISASKDNTLYEDANGALSNGAGQYFFAGKTNTGSIRRGLIAFNLVGSIPTGATITNVTLTLNMSQTATGDQVVSLRRVLADWGEGTSAAGGAEGRGGNSATNDATWRHRFFNATFWTTVGGDFSPTLSASTTVGGTGSYTWGSTAQMVSDVQGWLNNPAANFGWCVVGPEGTTRTAKRFDSRNNSSSAVRPRLTVTYTGGLSVRETGEQPTKFSLSQNYPNPFNPTTRIKFEIASSQHTVLKVFDILGKEIATLVNENLDAGVYETTFEPSNIPTGVYFYRLQAGSFSETKKLMLTQ